MSTQLATIEQVSAMYQHFNDVLAVANIDPAERAAIQRGFEQFAVTASNHIEQLRGALQEVMAQRNQARHDVAQLENTIDDITTTFQETTFDEIHSRFWTLGVSEEDATTLAQFVITGEVQESEVAPALYALLVEMDAIPPRPDEGLPLSWEEWEAEPDYLGVEDGD